MPRGKKQGKSRGKRRSAQEVQQLLGQLETMRSAGEPLMKALEKLGISYSNYNYWQKKSGAKSTGKRGRGAAVGTGGRGVMGVLDAMKKNRADRDDHEKAIRALDAQFSQLKSKLGRG